MSEYCVVVADGSRARILSLNPVELPELESGPNLEEVETLVNPDNSAGGELWSDGKSGRNRSAAGAHGYDDHRDRHVEELGRRFAREVVRRTAELARGHGSRQVVMVAEPRMLGHLRSELEPLLKAGLSVTEHARDLSKLAPRELHELLARESLLPARRERAG